MRGIRDEMETRISRTVARAWHALVLTALLGVVAAGPLWAQASTTKAVAPMRDVALEQKLNAQVPLDSVFTDEAGKRVKLGQYFGKRPVVLVLVWYKCPGICGVELEGMVKGFRRQQFQIGRDYEVVTISINPAESPELAASKKAEYVKMLDRPGAAAGWHWLTGDKANIDRVAEAIGYRYVYDTRTGQYAHPAGILVLTPDGRVSRYFFGVDYRYRDLRLGLVEASERKVGTPADALLLLCYHYDPTTGRYGLVIMNIIRLAGGLTVLLLGGFIWLMLRAEHRRAAARTASGPGAEAPTHA